MEKIFNDFKVNSKVPTEIIEKYSTLVPKEIIDIWEQYGFGTFMQGYLKSVNPEEFIEILQVSSQRYNESIVLFATGMADLVLWADGFVRLLNFRYGIHKTLLPNFFHFFEMLEAEFFLNEYLNWQPYPEALKLYGELNYDECFGYTPLLGLGGEEKVENLKKVKLKEHILIITEFMGPIP